MRKTAGARHNYAIEDTFECGIVLKGSEVKSLRAHHVSFADSYAMIKNGEIFILGLRIEPFKQATHDEIDPDRTRKLLMKKKEITRLERMLSHKQGTLVPFKNISKRRSRKNTYWLWYRKKQGR